MDLTINVHGLSLTRKLQDYVEKKTQRLDRYMPTLTTVRVDLSERKAKNATERQVAQITVRDKRGTILRAEERGSDIFASVDVVMDKIYRQISRYKGKRQKRRRKQGDVDEFAMAEPLPIEEVVSEDEPTILRRKQFSLRPMPPEDHNKTLYTAFPGWYPG